MAGTSCRPLERGVVVFARPADDEGSEDLRATVQSAHVELRRAGSKSARERRSVKVKELSPTTRAD
jgi:hypothetical protein